ncbi:MAG: hypothetical protein MSS87_01245, partial [Bacteroidales bacterium]|nr:hypothetical protein [Bacteroidales bacterium]
MTKIKRRFVRLKRRFGKINRRFILPKRRFIFLKRQVRFPSLQRAIFLQRFGNLRPTINIVSACYFL